MRTNTRGTLGTIPGVDSAFFRAPARHWGEQLASTCSICLLTTVLLDYRVQSTARDILESVQQLDIYHRLLFELRSASADIW